MTSGRNSKDLRNQAREEVIKQVMPALTAANAYTRTVENRIADFLERGLWGRLRWLFLGQ